MGETMENEKSTFQRLAPELAGIAVGLQILFKGIDKAHDFSDYPLHVGFLFLAGLFVIAASIYNGIKKGESKRTHALFHLIEGAAIIVSAWILFDKGRFRMPAFLAFVGCLYVLMGIIGYKLNRGNYKRYAKPLMRGSGLAFLLFGLTAVIWNWNYDKDKWVFGIAVLFVLIGAFYMTFAGWLLSVFERADKSKDGKK